MIRNTEALAESKPQQLLFAFIKRFNAFTDEEVTLLMQNLNVTFFKKDTHLVKPGDVVTKCYFVLEGCLRKYNLHDGVEQTIDFYTEHQAAVLFTSYYNQAVAESYLVCLEDSIVLVGDMDSENYLFEKIPALQKITRVMVEQDFGKVQDTLAKFIASTPEERYQTLLRERPELMQRVPQHQVASYLGVTPESLSRIRKRILLSR